MLNHPGGIRHAPPFHLSKLGRRHLCPINPSKSEPVIFFFRSGVMLYFFTVDGWMESTEGQRGAAERPDPMMELPDRNAEPVRWDGGLPPLRRSWTELE